MAGEVINSQIEDQAITESHLFSAGIISGIYLNYAKSFNITTLEGIGFPYFVSKWVIAAGVTTVSLLTGTFVYKNLYLLCCIFQCTTAIGGSVAYVKNSTGIILSNDLDTGSTGCKIALGTGNKHIKGTANNLLFYKNINVVGKVTTIYLQRP